MSKPSGLKPLGSLYGYQLRETYDGQHDMYIYELLVDDTKIGIFATAQFRELAVDFKGWLAAELTRRLHGLLKEKLAYEEACREYDDIQSAVSYGSIHSYGYAMDELLKASILTTSQVREFTDVLKSPVA